MRVFIAAELPEKVKKDIETIEGVLNLGQFPITWVKKSKIHLTILFLGEIKPEQVEPIKKILAEEAARLSPIELKLARLGCFPGFSRPNVIWVGLGGEVDALDRLSQRLRQKIGKLGIKLDPKSFSAHLTLGRVKRWAKPRQRRQIGNKIASTQVRERNSFSVKSLTLFESQLTPEGPIYKALERVNSGGN